MTTEVEIGDFIEIEGRQYEIADFVITSDGNYNLFLRKPNSNNVMWAQGSADQVKNHLIKKHVKKLKGAYKLDAIDE